MIPKFDIIVANHVADALELIESARHLRPISNQPFPTMQLYWLAAFVRHYGKSRNLAITTICEGNRISSLIPFQLSLDHRQLTFTCDETADFTDIYCVNEDCKGLEAVIKFWASRGVDTFTFERLPLNSPTIQLLIRVADSNQARVSIEVAEIAPYLLFDNEPIDCKMDRVKSSSIRKYLHKLETLTGRYSLEFIRDFDLFKAVWPMLRSLHVERWAQKGNFSKYSDVRRSSFIEEVCFQAAEREELFVPLLRIDGRIAAFIISFWIGDRVFDWNTSFANEFGNYSPGNLLLIETLRRLQQFKIKRYDFLTGCEAHKLLWANQFDGNIKVQIRI